MAERPPSLAVKEGNARGKNATFPSLHPVPADRCRSPQGCLPTTRGRRRGYSNAPGFASARVGMGRAGVFMATRYSPAMHRFFRACRADGLFKNLIAIVWMHGGIAV